MRRLSTARPRLSRACIEAAGQAIPLEYRLGIPVTDAMVGGNATSLFVDTGAKYGYLREDLLRQFPVVNRVRDFHPSLGEFDTSLHRVELAIGDLRFESEFGRLPPELAKALQFTGVQGILGNDLFRARTIVLSARRRMMTLGESA